MKTPHKHAALIKAWADGAEIEYKSPTHGIWQTANDPGWLIDVVYRIKPEQKPDTVQKRYVSVLINQSYLVSTLENLKLTFDGETGKLKAAEVL